MALVPTRLHEPRLVLGDTEFDPTPPAYAYLLGTIQPDHWYKMDEVDIDDLSPCLDSAGAQNLQYKRSNGAGSKQAGLHDGLPNGSTYMTGAFTGKMRAEGADAWGGVDTGELTLAGSFYHSNGDSGTGRVILWGDNGGGSSTYGQLSYQANCSALTISVSFVMNNGAGGNGTTLVFSPIGFVYNLAPAINDIAFAWKRNAGDATDAYFVCNGVEYACTLDVGTYTELTKLRTSAFWFARGNGSQDGPTACKYDDIFTKNVQIPAAELIAYQDLLVA